MCKICTTCGSIMNYDPYFRAEVCTKCGNMEREEKEHTTMENQFDANKIAALTGTAVQDDETFQSEGGFVPERDQYYFQMKQGDNTFLVGFKDLLISLRLLETMGEIPKIGQKWWLQMATLYGTDILTVECEK